MHSFSLRFLIGTGLILGVSLGACSSDDSSGTVADACTMVIDACHPKDDGTDDVINGCHSRAHDGDDAQCSMDLQECIAACDAAPAIGGDTDGHDSGDHDSGHDHDSGDSTGGHGHDSGDSTGHGHEGSSGDTAAESSGGDDSSEASCEALGSLCHDTSDRLGMMCHDIGHDGDEAACAKVWVECIAHCDH